MTTVPAPREPKSWRAAARRLLASLRSRRGAGVGSIEAAEFDAAARHAYRAALKLDMGSRAPASPPVRSAEAAGPVLEPPATAAAEAPTRAAIPGTQTPPSDWPNGPAGAAAESAIAAPHRPQSGETAPDSLFRTPSNVTLVADEFFDSLIRRVESDR